ncbi:cytochrome b [Paraburkholderia sediminicola]|uniref:cytochrome b n=1 Tax=Paraburkholderia sediminicola TaxID=458836 RepID=UPI0038BCF45E
MRWSSGHPVKGNLNQTLPPGSPEKYTASAMALHWIIAARMISGFAIGWVMTDIPGFTPTKLRYFSWHKWIGCTVFALAIIRLLWRAMHAAPRLSPGVPAWQRRAAQVTHLALYVLMFVIPATGYLYSSASNVPVVYLGLVRLPSLIAPNPVLKPLLKYAHIYLNYALLLLVGLHVLAALKHQFLDRDGLLSRMLPFAK